MKHSRIGRALLILLCVSLLCQMLVGLSACATAEDALYETQISSVKLNRAGDSVSISATLSKEDAVSFKNRAICLFALEPFQSLTMIENGAVLPLAESRSSESMHFSVDFYFDYGRRNRLTQRFLLAARDENGVCTPITEAVYISNPEILASGSNATVGDSLKGVAISTADDVTLLSPSHTVIDIPIENYILPAPKSVNTISYLYAGETLSLSETAVEALDEQVKRLSATGSLIYLRPLLVSSPDSLGELSSLGYPGSTESVAYALNLGGEEGYFYVAGFFSFLAERYRAVSGVIPGVMMNDPTYNGSTVSSFDLYVESVLSLVRVAYNIFRSENSSVQVYLPVGNLFTTDGAVAVTERGTREFLGAFAAYAKKSGDFDWSIYLSMLMSDGQADSIYNESGTVNADGVTEKYLFPQTVSSLMELLASNELKFGNVERSMIWGLSVSGNGDVGAVNQEMSLLYTYMKALQLNQEKKHRAVQAVVWETLTDSDTASHGLLSLDGAPKPSGELFSVLGRADLSSAVNLTQVATKLGARYTEISGVLAQNSERLLAYSGTLLGSDSVPARAEETLIFGGNIGWENTFLTLPGTGAVSIRRQHYDTAPVLVATFESGIGCGIYASEISATQLKDREILALVATAALPEGYETAKLRVILSGHSDGQFMRYTGEAVVTDGVWSTLRFDISEFASELGDGKLTLTVSMIHTGASETAGATLYLSSISALETQNWFMRGGWIVFFVIILLVALTVFVIWFFHTYEVRWTAGGERGKRTADQKGSFRDRLARLRKSFAEHTEVRRKSRSRIMVKPGSDTATAASAKGIRDTADESDGFEALEDLFEDSDELPEGSVSNVTVEEHRDDSVTVQSESTESR